MKIVDIGICKSDDGQDMYRYTCDDGGIIYEVETSATPDEFRTMFEVED